MKAVAAEQQHVTRLERGSADLHLEVRAQSDHLGQDMAHRVVRTGRQSLGGGMRDPGVVLRQLNEVPLT